MSVKEATTMTCVTRCPRAGLWLVAILALTSCGPARPGAITPTLPPPGLWNTYMDEGQKAFQQERYAEAEKFFKAALEEAEKLRIVDADDPKSPGFGDPRVATSLISLADLYLAQGKADEAIPLYQQCLALTEATLGPEEPFVAIALDGLGRAYVTQGKHAEAEVLFRRAILINEKKLGANHPAVATSLSNLADLYVAQGKPAEAEALYKRALAIREASLGPNHLEVAASLNSLALLYFSQGNVAQAKPLYQQSLAIRAKVLGPNHPSFVASLEKFSTLLRKAEGEPQRPASQPNHK
ncbi:MAG: tetratricopeptide repeat protein [Nitrospiraceae bacterium]